MASSPSYMLAAGGVVAVCAGGVVAGLSLWWAYKKPPVIQKQGLAPASETKPSKKNLRETLVEKGVQAAKISLGCVVYELLGVVFLIGSLAFCWLVQPTKILQSVLPNLDGSSLGRLQEMFGQAAEKAERISTNLIKKIGWVPEDPARLSKALAESLFLRMLLKPILLPLKLGITYFLVK